MTAIMGKIPMVLCILVSSLCIELHAVSIADQMAEITQLCCNQGLAYAKNHTSQDCSSSVPPDVPVSFGSLCISAMDGCCKEYFMKRHDCEDGVQLAIGGRCIGTKSDTAQDCCTECMRGHKDGATGTCAGRGGRGLDPVAGDAYARCCQEAIKGSDSKTTSTPKNVVTPDIDLSSICEEYAPNELCAHHCIPVPGSYRCECNPGYMLMADGRNCKEVQKNRCKPRNPCQHKCNDNGVEVKCSCRRGYQLQSDGRSCKDIDECLLNPPVCLPNTECHNTQGSYKCIPVKKNSVGKGQCPPGFVRNAVNNVCDDVNECTLPTPPCPKYLCENTVGGYKCQGVAGDPANLPNLGSGVAVPNQPDDERCPPGFKAGLNEDCEDINECETNKHDCNTLSQFCINVQGSFYCQNKMSKHCLPGFKINPQTGVCEDIDECADTSVSLCKSDQICMNVPGAYDCKAKTDLQARPTKKCPEGTRLDIATSVCEDIDECVEGTHMCDQHQSCLNTYGSHECRCKLGFQHDPLTGACVDVNECATNKHTCVPESQRCDNTIGSYLCVRIISCGTGYVLQYATGKCEDIDECAVGTDNCAMAGSEYECVNNPGSFRCVKKKRSTTSTTSTSTPSPDDYYYYDSEEEETPSEANNTVSSSLAPTSPTKQPEIEEPMTTTTAKPEPPPSPETPVTSATPGTFTTPSTTPNIKSTEPQYPVTYPTPTPTPSSRPTEPQSPEVDSRVDPNPTPDINAITYNYPPARPQDNFVPSSSEIPAIKPYYPEMTYKPPLEPEIPKEPENVEPPPTTTPRPNPETPHEVFVDVSIERKPAKEGNHEDGPVVINNQNLPNTHRYDVFVQPEQSECQQGFERNAFGACVDVDECTTGKHICLDTTESCRNTNGGYVCDCATGFRRDFSTGTCDVTAATTSSTTPIPVTTPPVRPTSSTSQTPSIWNQWGYSNYRPPLSRPFRPWNVCDVGYHMSVQTGRCEDVDECTNGIANCAAVEVCVNTEGGYRCECPPNWQLDDIRHRCVPIRETGKFPPGYGNIDSEPPQRYDPNRKVVTVVSGSRFGSQGHRIVKPTVSQVGDSGGVLKCPWGYRLDDDNRCVDIDECALGTASCGLTQLCTNLPGGYTCNCPPGHQLVGNNTCEDVDECSLAGPRPLCSEHADCVNTVGSYRCRCHEGFRTAPANDKVCVDVDECTESRAGSLCQHRCNNVWGGYRCTCHRGYRLNADNKTCSDIDECRDFASKNLCIGRCLNDPGSYHCSCPSGYRLSEDKRSCIDIDECETGEAPCASGGTQFGVSDVCLNTRGGYRCQRIVCPSGYQLENKHRCSRIDRICSVMDWECIHQPSTYSYNYITFVSKLYIPSTRVDLFTMRGPTWRSAQIKFELRLVDVNAPPTVKEKADINAFSLTPSRNQAVVSLVRSLEGPQSVELELIMELYNGKQFGGTAVAKIFIYVSEYEF